MERINELKVDKSLLVNDFDTYKLNLDKLTISEENVPGGVSVRYPTEDQFSFLHHREFTLCNHLHEDLWNKNDIYLITTEGKVLRSLINSQTERLIGLTEVWKIPGYCSISKCNFNASLNFPSPELAVITDGVGFLYITNTSNRIEIFQWKTLCAEKVLGDENEFKIIHCMLEDDKKTDSNRILHCILLLIESSVSDGKNSSFETVLKWVIFKEEDDHSWQKLSMNEIRCRGSVDYVALESGCQALYIITDSELHSPKMVLEKSRQNDADTSNGSEPDYYWQQTSKDVKVWFQINSNVERSDLNIITNFNSLDISIKESKLLSGNLFHRIYSQQTEWSLNNSKLEIKMEKEEKELVWNNLFLNDECNDKKGREIVDEEFVSQIHAKLSHLCSDQIEENGGTAMLNSGELEECDAFGENRFLYRFNKECNKVTHKIMLGSDQWLFAPLLLATDRLPAFCMRRDVDGLVWQPLKPTEIDNNLFQCIHVHTFPALGYIAASRQDRKFLVAPPSMSYVALIQSVGHVIVFRKTELLSTSGLRNRRTSEIKNSLYIQNLVNLGSNNPTVGAIAFDQYLFVLTSKDLIMINIK